MAPRGMKAVYIFARLLAGICLAAVAFSTVLTLLYFVALFYLFYRLVWLCSADGTILRMEWTFKRHIEKLSLDGSNQRATFSKTVDQNNIDHLVMLVNEAMDLRKTHLNPDITPEIHCLLIRCRNTMDFNQALLIYKTVVDTDVALLNASLEELLDD
ncbi:MAG: hypothetical protein HOP23_16690 [Methylococcaceae bacterium]|nr:hypothetical protein [Methylococcaceae bacterium]